MNNLLKVVIISIICFLYGGIWYGVIFAETWQKLNKITPETINEMNLIRVYLGSFMCIFIMNIAIFVIIDNMSQDSLIENVAMGTIIGFGLLAASTANNYIYHQKSLKAYLIDAGYQATFPILSSFLLFKIP